MHDAEIPICAIYTADEAVNSPEAKARGVIAFRDNGKDGAVPYFRDPLQRAGLTDPTRFPAPSLGENSEEIRQRFALGKSAALKRSRK
jgi:crotonobetainyl-CoA:carnitine CoA-transferase CaiB-like acyl-CoA transferase